MQIQTRGQRCAKSLTSTEDPHWIGVLLKEYGGELIVGSPRVCWGVGGFIGLEKRLMNIMQKLILFTKDILAESCYMLLVANMNIEHSVTSFP